MDSLAAHPFVVIAAGALVLLWVQTRLDEMDAERSTPLRRRLLWHSTKLSLVCGLLGFFFWSQAKKADAERIEHEARHSRPSRPAVREEHEVFPADSYLSVEERRARTARQIQEFAGQAATEPAPARSPSPPRGP